MGQVLCISKVLFLVVDIVHQNECFASQGASLVSTSHPSFLGPLVDDTQAGPMGDSGGAFS